MLNRRNALKLLASAAALPPLHADLLSAFRAVHAALPSAPALKVLNLHQNATVSAMIDLILPRTTTPGALDVRVNEFIDLILADWYDEKDRALFLQGLAEVDALSQQSFAKDFSDATPAQQSSILTNLGEQLAHDLQSLSAAPRGYRGAAAEPSDNFYFRFRQLTLIGYFTSEAGAAQQLDWQVIPPRVDPCAALPAQKQARK